MLEHSRTTRLWDIFLGLTLLGEVLLICGLLGWSIYYDFSQEQQLQDFYQNEIEIAYREGFEAATKAMNEDWLWSGSIRQEYFNKDGSPLKVTWQYNFTKVSTIHVGKIRSTSQRE